MPLAPRTKLGPYEIVSSLGAGGMGEVYRARDESLGREVAIKVLPIELASDQDRLRRFEQEARAAAALNHPNILAVYGFSTTEEHAPYLIAELLQGQTLPERLQEGEIPVRKAVEFALQMTRGLAAAHARGIVHRDLKPENLFLTRDGVVKILDFGLAKLVSPSVTGPQGSVATVSVTELGVVLGTVGYMSPRASARTGPGSSQRYLQPGRDRLRDAVWKASVSGEDERGHHECNSQGGACRAFGRRPQFSSGAGAHRTSLSGQGPGRTVSISAGSGLQSGVAQP